MRSIRPGTTRVSLCWVSAAAAVQLLANEVQAAEPAAEDASAGAAQLSEVVVTATRRGDQNLLNTPIAVNAYSGKMLQDFNVQSFQDVTKIDPSINVQSFGATQQQFIIRGIASSIGQTTGIYVNESPLVGGFNGDVFGDGTPGLRLHDVDHIEVLKGPQGTLFGAGSMDGTLRVVTNKPNLTKFEGAVEATGAGVDGGNLYSDGVLTLDAPIVSDVLGVRMVVWGENGGGFVDQTIGGVRAANVNDEHLYGGRLTALWKPLDELSVQASITDQETRVDGSQAWTVSVGSPDFRGPRVGPSAPYNNYSYSKEPFKDSYRLADLTVEYDLGFGDVVANGGYARKHNRQPDDGSSGGCLLSAGFFCQGSPFFPTSFTPDFDFSDRTAEIRFSSKFKGPFQFVAGAFYEADSTVVQETAALTAADGTPYCSTLKQCVGGGFYEPGFGHSKVLFANAEDFKVNQYALYAQGDYKIIDSLTATVGVRYFAANLHDVSRQLQDIAVNSLTFKRDGFAFGLITPPYVLDDLHSHESKPTFNFALLWAATDEVSLYTRAASGFRVGGINTSAAFAAQYGVIVPVGYQPDSLWDYEIGSKMYLFNRTLYIDASVYHIDWSGQQLQGQAGGSFNYVVNVGKTKTTGAELSLTYRPVTGLTLGGSVTYVDSKLGEDLPAEIATTGTPGTKGDRVPLVPHISFSGRAEYEWPLRGDLNGYVQSAFNYRGSSFSAFEPTSADQNLAGNDNFYSKLPAYFLLDAKVGLRFHDYDVSLFAQNLTNRVAYAGLLPSQDAFRVYSPRPRTIGVHASARF